MGERVGSGVGLGAWGPATEDVLSGEEVGMAQEVDTDCIVGGGCRRGVEVCVGNVADGGKTERAILEV